MIDWIGFVKYLQSLGFTVSGIALIFLVAFVIYRNYSREKSFDDRQKTMDERLDSELNRLVAQRDDCQKALDECRKVIAELSVANIQLDRWKSLCTSLCPNSDEVHVVKLKRLP